MKAQEANALQADIARLKRGNVMMDISHKGLISLSGEDTKTFLQGQVTNDVNAVNASHSQYSGYCTPKGRLLAFFFAFQHDQKLYLSLDAALAPSVQKRLQMFVMRSKVTLSDEQDSTIRLGFSGDQAAALLSKHFDSVPEAPYDVVSDDAVTIIRMPFAKPTFQLITSADNSEALNAKLSADFDTVDAAGWEWLAIQSGIPEIVTATQDTFVPQMVNLEKLDAVNFKKGCYTGQEIVARTHYLGKVSRRAYIGSLSVSDEIIPAAGDEVSDENGYKVGQVLRVSPDGAENRVAILFECRTKNIESPLNWENNPIQTYPLPYSIADEES